MTTSISTAVVLMFLARIGPSDAFFPGSERSLVRCDSWTEAGVALRQREVPAALVESVGLSPCDGWRHAREGDSTVVLNLDAPREKNIKAASIALDFLDEDVLPGLIELAERYREVQEFAAGRSEASSNVRCRVTVASGKARTAPCPKVHTDNTLLRCLVPVMGPGTVFFPTPSFLGSLDNKESGAVATQAGSALLLKGRLWPTGSAAHHKSPDPVDSTRILVSLDRLEDFL